ncbi:acyltransferase [Streptacidiphilus sp. 4-A2]|nr:acyltransferase [Streptacidiphilus sp. 4-A2]
MLMGPHVAPTTMYWFTYLCPLFRSLEFWLGAAVGQLVVTRAYRGPGLWTSMALVVAVYAGNRWIPAQYWNLDLDVGFVLLIAAAARADLSGARSPWRYRPLVWLGEVSFAFYMVHVQLVSNVMRLVGRGGTGWHGAALPVALPVLLGCAVLTAYLLYRSVEVPLTKRLRPRGTAR